MELYCLPCLSGRSRKPTTINKMLNNADGRNSMTYYAANRYLRNVSLGLNSRDIDVDPTKL